MHEKNESTALSHQHHTLLCTGFHHICTITKENVTKTKLVHIADTKIKVDVYQLVTPSLLFFVTDITCLLSKWISF